MKCFKLTDNNGKTRNFTQWGSNVTHTATGTDPNLCSNGWIHFYMDPWIAVVMNPIHVEFHNPILWEAEAEGEVIHELFKSGSKTLTTIRQIPLPEISLNQRIALGIYCAKEVFEDGQWNNWADKWLSGEDRSKESAVVASNAGCYAAANAANAAYYSSAYYSATAIDYSIDVNNKINFRELLNKAMLIK